MMNKLRLPKGKLLVLLSFFMVLSSQTKASHVFGGELTWMAVKAAKRTPSGTLDTVFGYVFTLTVYRDCSGTTLTLGDSLLKISPAIQSINHNTGFIQTINSIPMTRAPGIKGTGFEVTPICGGASNIVRCGSNPLGSTGASKGALAGIQLVSDTMWLYGQIPASGITIYTTDGFNSLLPCCRNANNNTTGSCSNMMIRAKMFPYTDPRFPLSSLPLHKFGDSSPQFSEPPFAATVRNPLSDTIVYNNNAVDFDLDFSRYHIDVPWDSYNTPCTYGNGYTINTPMPGLIFPYPGGAINGPIDTLSGEIKFKPTTTGNFLLCIKVESYRGNRKIAEVYRDFQSLTIDNTSGIGYDPTKSPPLVSNPWNGTTTGTAFANSYFVEDQISFPVIASTSGANITDSVYLVFNKGTVFGAFDLRPVVDTIRQDSGCVRPPCAMLKPGGSTQVIKEMYLNGVPVGYGVGGKGISPLKFLWNTTCQNLKVDPSPFNGNQNFIDRGNYSFTLTARDNQCPFNGKVTKTLSIDLKAIPVIKPSAKGLSLENNGIKINFGSLIDLQTKELEDKTLFSSIRRRAKSLKEVQIWRGDSCSFGGAYTYKKVGSIVPPTNLNDTALVHWFFQLRNWTDTFAVNPSCGYRYFFKTRSGCDLTQFTNSDTFSLIQARAQNISGSAGTVSWSSPVVGTNTSGKIIVRRKIGGAFSTAKWDTVYTTTTIGAGLFQDNSGKVCDDSMTYQVAWIQPVVNYRDTIFQLDNCTSDSTKYNSLRMFDYRRNTWPTGWPYDLVSKSFRVQTDSFNVAPPGECLKGVFLINGDIDTGYSLSGLVSIRYRDTIQTPMSYMMNASPDTTAANQPIILTCDTVNAADFNRYTFFYSANNDSVGYDSLMIRGKYTDVLHNGTAQSYSYKVNTRDFCNNTSGLSESLKTIFLQITTDHCRGTIDLSWNSPGNWVGGVRSYYIMINDGTKWKLVDSVPANVTSYSDSKTNFSVGDSYCYTIWAVNQADPKVIMNSNQVCALANLVNKTRDLYVRYASVDTTTQQVKLAWLINKNAEVKEFRIMRNSGSGFTQVGTVPAGNPVQVLSNSFAEYQFQDATAEVSGTTNEYQIISLDICDDTAQSRNIGKTILLTGKALADFTNSLSWTEYLEWKNNVKDYRVFMNMPSVSAQYKYLNNVSGAGVRQYIDNVFSYEDNDGNFCYLIMAVEDGQNIFGVQDTSFSNRLCVSQDPRFFVPTAIVPGGLNNKFFPKGTYINKKSNYHMEIYGRWGEKVFETNNFDEGWDGYFKGKMVQPGMFVYMIHFQDANGRNLTQKGYFQVID